VEVLLRLVRQLILMAVEAKIILIAMVVAIIAWLAMLLERFQNYLHM